MTGVVEALRWEVYSRDDGKCIAAVVDAHAGPCYDRYGVIIDTAPRLTFEQCEMDYVRLNAVGPRHTLPEDHVIVCPGHHRGQGPSRGYQWATSHRAEERAYLDGVHGITRLGDGVMNIDSGETFPVSDIVMRGRVDGS